MKQFLTCGNCEYQLSDEVVVYDSTMENCPEPDLSWMETVVADKEVCFHAEVDLIEACAAFKKLSNLVKRKRFLIFWKMKVETKLFSLKDIEDEAKSSCNGVNHQCFSHLRFAPQYWLSIADLSIHVETKEDMSWGWEGTNTSNVFCSNCDVPIGTEIAYFSEIPITFIPDPKATNWSIVKS